MAHYAYKCCIFDEIPKEWRDDWERRFEDEAGRAPDGDANYDGDFWHMAAAYVRFLANQLSELTELRAAAKTLAEQAVLDALPDLVRELPSPDELLADKRLSVDAKAVLARIVERSGLACWEAAK